MSDPYRVTDSRKPEAGRWSTADSEQPSPEDPAERRPDHQGQLPGLRGAPTGSSASSGNGSTPRHSPGLCWGVTAGRSSMISEEMARRRSAQEPLIQRMLSIRDRYDADVVVPVAETDDDVPYDWLPAATIADAIDHRRCTPPRRRPTSSCPAIDPPKCPGALDRLTPPVAARPSTTRGICPGGRWSSAASTAISPPMPLSALVVELDEADRCPDSRPATPLPPTPSRRPPRTCRCPPTSASSKASASTGSTPTSPETRDRFPRGSGYAAQTSAEGEIWDWSSGSTKSRPCSACSAPATCTTRGPRSPSSGPRSSAATRTCSAAARRSAPRRVTLDRICRQLANLTGHVDLMAKLMYLDIRATEKAVFPDKYVYPKTGQNPRLVGGQWLDGSTGEVNLITDADAVRQPARPRPTRTTRSFEDRLERNFRDCLQV